MYVTLFMSIPSLTSKSLGICSIRRTWCPVNNKLTTPLRSLYDAVYAAIPVRTRFAASPVSYSLILYKLQ